MSTNNPEQAPEAHRPTPRTDELSEKLRPQSWQTSYTLMRDHARTMERDLAANETMRKASKRFQEAAWAFEDSTELEPESEESNRIYSEFCDASDALTAALTASAPKEKP